MTNDPLWKTAGNVRPPITLSWPIMLLPHLTMACAAGISYSSNGCQQDPSYSNDTGGWHTILKYVIQRFKKTHREVSNNFFTHEYSFCLNNKYSCIQNNTNLLLITVHNSFYIYKMHIGIPCKNIIHNDYKYVLSRIITWKICNTT